MLMGGSFFSLFTKSVCQICMLCFENVKYPLRFFSIQCYLLK